MAAGYWFVLKSDLFKKRNFDSNETMSKHIQISLVTGKHLDGDETLGMRVWSFTKKRLPTDAFLKNLWSFTEHNSQKQPPEKGVHKRLTLFALKRFKDNQNITKVESNILLMRSTQQRKWYLAGALTTQTCFAKKVFWNIGQTHRKTSLSSSFFSLYVGLQVYYRYSWINVFLWANVKHL